MGTFTRKLRTFRQLPPIMIGLAAATLGIIVITRLALWTIPFRTIRRIVDSTPPVGFLHGTVSPRQVAWLVTVASRYVFRATCLTQALTAQVLLNAAAIPHHLHIGVAMVGAPLIGINNAGVDIRDKTFESHAWIECDGRILIGGAQQSARFAKILTLAGSQPDKAG